MVGLTTPYACGNQSRSKSRILKKCGCGVVALGDLVLHLSGETAADRDGFFRMLLRRYLPIVPPFGTTGVHVAAAFNRWCRHHRLPYRAVWNFFRENLYSRMEEMLRENIPVILSIGPGMFRRLQLYRRCGKLHFPVCRVRGHFVTVTGLDERWIRVVSWGRVYYICRKDYEEYGKRSAFLTSNILYVKKT